MNPSAKPHLKDFIGYIVLIIVAVAVVSLLFSTDRSVKPKETNSTVDKTATASNSANMKHYASKPALTINPKKSYSATITTDKGVMKVELFASETPETVNNFVFLSKDHYYDNTIFHRVIKDFMIQGGDPKGDGTGGPGYTFDDEKITRDYKRGTLAMANRGSNTNGSQFFIMHKDYDLPKNYVIFGQLTDGFDVLDAIATSEVTDSGSGESSKPMTPVKIEKIDILEK